MVGINGGKELLYEKTTLEFEFILMMISKISNIDNNY